MCQYPFRADYSNTGAPSESKNYKDQPTPGQTCGGSTPTPTPSPSDPSTDSDPEETFNFYQHYDSQLNKTKFSVLNYS